MTHQIVLGDDMMRQVYSEIMLTHPRRYIVKFCFGWPSAKKNWRFVLIFANFSTRPQA